MASVNELQKEIFEKEGFRVTFERLDGAKGAIPSYDYTVMAPNGWRLSDWKRVRLAPYVTQFKGIIVYRGDGSPQRTDVKLGRLRDTYYEAEYGSIAPEPEDNVVQLKGRTRGSAQKRSAR
jgi:hypothetical protein